MNPRDRLNDDPADLAALYVAGALTDDERAAVEARLARGEFALANEVRSFDAVVAALAEAPPVTPDPHLRAELLRRVAGQETPPAGLFIRRADEGAWVETGDPGVTRRVLYFDRASRRVTVLFRMAAGSRYRGHAHAGVEESLVLEGDLRVGGLVLRAGDYQRAEPGSDHDEQSTEGGCLVLVTAALGEAA
jgi:anti-sigma factor ChrR (cupin superfamily)